MSERAPEYPAWGWPERGERPPKTSARLWLVRVPPGKIPDPGQPFDVRLSSINLHVEFRGDGTVVTYFEAILEAVRQIPGWSVLPFPDGLSVKDTADVQPEGVKEALAILGIKSIAQAAREFGVTRQHLSGVANGRLPLSLELWRKITHRILYRYPEGIAGIENRFYPDRRGHYRLKVRALPM